MSASFDLETNKVTRSNKETKTMPQALVELRSDDEIPAESTVLTPSFTGRLNISEFAFSPGIQQKHAITPINVCQSPRTTESPQSRCPGPRDLRRKVSQLSDAPAQPPSQSTHDPLPRPNKKRKQKQKQDADEVETKPKSRGRSTSRYAPPSTYAHLSPLTDVITPDLLVLFVGLNPGIQTSVQGHAYAHPTNKFWKLLHSSGCTPRLCQPSEDRDLPRLYGLGNTNIVSRPTRNGAELTKSEMDGSVHVLEDKIARFRPEVVAVVGKGVWESVWRVRKKRGFKDSEFKYGWQNEEENMGRDSPFGTGCEFRVDDKAWRGSRVFVAASTSGLAATLRPTEKENIWNELGSWARKRREEKGWHEGEDFLTSQAVRDIAVLDRKIIVP